VRRRNGKIPASSAVPWPPARLAISRNFGKPGNDRLKLSGTLPAADDFGFTNKQIVVDCGGAAQAFTLSAKGAAAPSDTARIKIGKPRNSAAKFNVQSSKTALADFFLDESLLNVTVKDVPRHVTVVILVNDAFLQAALAQTYTARENRTGKTKQPRL
jgi:hypothetical protein